MIKWLFPSEINMSEEQLARQLISLHRAVSHRDKQFLRQLVRRCDNKLDMSLPLRGVTALSLSIYLKHPDMASELLGIMKQNRQIGNLPQLVFIMVKPDLFSVNFEWNKSSYTSAEWIIEVDDQVLVLHVGSTDIYHHNWFIYSANYFLQWLTHLTNLLAKLTAINFPIFD